MALGLKNFGLGRFYNDISKFHKDQGPGPAPGSVALSEQAASQDPVSLVIAQSIATHLIESGGEHVTAFVKTITEPMEPIACWTCVRSILESCSLASWLLDPGIDARTRVGRVFAIRHNEIVQSLTYMRALGEGDNDLRRTEKRIDQIDQDALNLGYPPIVNARGKRIGIGQRMPSATEVIKLMLDEEIMYRLLSAVAHGHSWAIRGLSFTRTPEAAVRPDVGGIPVTMFEKMIAIDRLALLGVTAATAFAKPVWYKCQFFGWDEDTIVAIPDSIFDDLQAAQAVRFWRYE